MQQKIKQILIQYWGYSAFRPMQEDIILSVLEGNDTLALLPTGGGKSITFQVPALAMEGICIVITPLIALMKDQVAALEKKNIKAKALYSGMHNDEIMYILENAVRNELKFLYISPERAVSSTFRNYFEKMKVNIIAVDEAHCISQWGHDFRPPYLQIAELRAYHPKTPILALTATATPEVEKDICSNLQFKKDTIFRKSFYRRNLTYEVYEVEDKLKRLLAVCDENKGSGIVYVRNRKKTKELATFLHLNKISADFYHAGLSGEERDKKQFEWTSNKRRVIVSTNAFGMGIDKPDVRFVVHMDIPDCIEAYFQEAGRAGRDEKNARCIILFNQADIDQSQKQLIQSFPEPSFIRKVYSLLGNFFQIAVGSGNDVTMDFNLHAFTESYQLPPIETFHALQFLEKQGLILLSEAIHSPSRILITADRQDVYRFRVENPALDPLIQVLLRSFPGVFSDYVRIDESATASRMATETKNIISALKKLSQIGILSYIPYSDMPKVTFTQSRLDERDIRLTKEVYDHRKEKAFDRYAKMKEYVTSSAKCRSQALLHYFGETDAKRCGTCDVCMGRNTLSVNQLEFDSVVEILKPTLRKEPLPLKEVYNLFRSEDHKKVTEVLRWLFDNDKAALDTNGIVTWTHQSKKNN